MSTTIDPLVVDLGDVLRHPRFSPVLRDLVQTLADHPDDLTLEAVVEALGIDPLGLAQTLIAQAVGQETVAVLAADAEQSSTGGLH